MSGNGRFPYIGMTGGPSKIIARASGCTDPPDLLVELKTKYDPFGFNQNIRPSTQQ